MKIFLSALMILSIPVASSADFSKCDTAGETWDEKLCPVTAGCSGTCVKLTGTRPKCVFGYGGCHMGNTTRVIAVTREERQCTGTYGCACERGDLISKGPSTTRVYNCVDGSVEP